MRPICSSYSVLWAEKETLTWNVRQKIWERGQAPSRKSRAINLPDTRAPVGVILR